ncbi:MAG: rhodanese-like domain-containing protein [Oryzihumus sp.]
MTTTPRTIDVATLRSRLDQDAPRILDVRTPAEFETAHIPGSYNVPLDLLKEHRRELVRHIDEDVVLVCRSGARAGQAEQALGEIGLPGLRVLEGGIVSWQQAQAPVNRGRQTWDLERQVRLVAGSIVAASIAGSTVKPRLKWLGGAIGTGLTFAAISNTCAMGTALSKMPWNRPTTDVDVDAVIRALTSDD